MDLLLDSWLLYNNNPITTWRPLRHRAASSSLSSHPSAVVLRYYGMLMLPTFNSSESLQQTFTTVMRNDWGLGSLTRSVVTATVALSRTLRRHFSRRRTHRPDAAASDERLWSDIDYVFSWSLPHERTTTKEMKGRWAFKRSERCPAELAVFLITQLDDYAVTFKCLDVSRQL